MNDFLKIAVVIVTGLILASVALWALKTLVSALVGIAVPLLIVGGVAYVVYKMTSNRRSMGSRTNLFR